MYNTNTTITELASLLFVIVLLFWTGVIKKEWIKVPARMRLIVALAGLSISVFFLSVAIDTYNTTLTRSYFIFLPSSFLVGYFVVRTIQAIKKR